MENVATRRIVIIAYRARQREVDSALVVTLIKEGEVGCSDNGIINIKTETEHESQSVSDMPR
ncbi:hypothetical protein VPR01S_18_00380 [Vibrio proteolyticus NBRC 13287]|uniref:Uncharacterized protein n=1 Tax=Vibrio proteolyticus NBRC 13287 TaxID=1219065 RepID=U2ZLJ3_VIBPR|nr:hypothetical protein VPR01S_18_00380 [Vibrio proteolyticus NBRC 13287]